jgi:toxin ParE1/3/4
MARIQRSTASLRDVVEIARYVAQDNPTAAFNLVETIDAKFLLLARNPELGEARRELGANLRSFVMGNYVIVYRPIHDGIEVARVLHASRDLDSLF